MTKNYTGSIAESAVNSAPVSLLQLILRKISRRFSLARARRQLMALDDRMLKDIGLTRPDIKGNFWDSSRRNRAPSNPRIPPRFTTDG